MCSRGITKAEDNIWVWYEDGDRKKILYWVSSELHVNGHVFSETYGLVPAQRLGKIDQYVMQKGKMK